MALDLSLALVFPARASHSENMHTRFILWLSLTRLHAIWRPGLTVSDLKLDVIIIP